MRIINSLCHSGIQARPVQTIRPISLNFCMQTVWSPYTAVRKIGNFGPKLLIFKGKSLIFFSKMHRLPRIPFTQIFPSMVILVWYTSVSGYFFSSTIIINYLTLKHALFLVLVEGMPDIINENTKLVSLPYNQIKLANC